VEAVILAGGESWRMKPHVWVPKPLVELVEGVTLLEWQVAWLKKHGFSDVYVCASGFKIEELDVHWVEEREKLGTGGALKRAALQLRGDRFYAMQLRRPALRRPPATSLTRNGPSARLQ